MKIEKVQIPEIPDCDNYPIVTEAEVKRRYEKITQIMAEKRYSHIIVYGDREHFGNISYLTGGYDSRFEESLLIIQKDHLPIIVVGDEGFSYSDISLLKHRKELFQTFSLQGMIRDKKRHLNEIIKKHGINNKSKIGIVGIKYYEDGEVADPLHTFDIPHYIIQELIKLTPYEDLINITDIFTHPEYGIRCNVSHHELARFEFMSNYISNQMIKLIQNLDIGISESELLLNFEYKGVTFIYHPIVNFGTDRVLLGLANPTFEKKLKKGDAVSIAIGVSGANVARTGFAVHSQDDFIGDRKDIIEDFYYPYFKALKIWYESLSVETSTKKIYNDIMKLIGDNKFGVSLNPGHQIHLEEWINSPFREDFNYRLKSGMVLQCDIISFPGEPYVGIHVEDTVALADSKFREYLKSQYKDTWKRIKERQDIMRNILGININDDVLPLSNIQAVLHPFLLDPQYIVVDV